MTFGVRIDGPRVKATFSRNTVAEAINKANELVGRGTITITDPNGEIYSQYQFVELQARWLAEPFQSFAAKLSHFQTLE